QSILPAVHVKIAPPLHIAFRNLLRADRLVCVLFADERTSLAIERIGLGVPVAVDIAVPIERDQRLRPRLNSESSHESEIAPRGMADDRYPLRIDLVEFRAFRTHPFERVLHVLDDAFQLCLRRQAIVDRDDDIAGVEVALTLLRTRPIALADDQGAAVNPD